MSINFSDELILFEKSIFDNFSSEYLLRVFLFEFFILLSNVSFFFCSYFLTRKELSKFWSSFSKLGRTKLGNFKHLIYTKSKYSSKNSSVVEISEGAYSPQDDVEYNIPNTQSEYEFFWHPRNTKAFLLYSIVIFYDPNVFNAYLSNFFQQIHGFFCSLHIFLFIKCIIN
jgi:hypothetical protein